MNIKGKQAYQESLQGIRLDVDQPFAFSVGSATAVTVAVGTSVPNLCFDLHEKKQDHGNLTLKQTVQRKRANRIRSKLEVDTTRYAAFLACSPN